MRTFIGDVVAHCALDFWGRGPGFETGSFQNDPDAMQDHCVIHLCRKSQAREGNLPLRQKIIKRKKIYLYCLVFG